MANWDSLRERLNCKAERKGTLLKVCEVSALKSTECCQKPASGCVQTWLYCKVGDIDLTESQCDSHSLVCLPSITRFAFPKCKPVYRLKQVLHNDQREIVKLNTGCICA